TRGTVARLNYQGLTGLAHILLLEGGRSTEPLVPDNDNPPRIAMTPSLLDELGETGTATLREARQVLASLGAVLNTENRAHLATTLANLESASASMKPALDNLNLTLVQMRKVLDERNVASLSAAAGEVGPLLAEARVTLGKLQQTADKLDVAIGDPAANGAAALMPRLNEMAGDFSTTARQLSRVLRILEETPQGLVFGAPALPPGPGEPGFAAEVGR
ncbi:MAG TPA: MCE family protein, partial [Azonexus sp.]